MKKNEQKASAGLGIGRILFPVFYAVIGIVLLSVFSAPISVRILNPGNLLGLILGGGFLLYALLRGKLPQKLRRIFRILFLAGVLVLCVESFFIARQALSRPEKEEATLIILGCGVKGERPSLMLQQRIDAAAAYLQEHPSMKAVCTGGQGPGENISEGECIRRGLVAAGIGEDRLFVEDRSTSTSENLAYAAEILREKGLSPDLIIVSHEFHLYRACHMAGRLGLSAESVPARTPAWLFPTFFLRECLAILKEWILPDAMPEVAASAQLS